MPEDTKPQSKIRIVKSREGRLFRDKAETQAAFDAGGFGGFPWRIAQYRDGWVITDAPGTGPLQPAPKPKPQNEGRRNLAPARGQFEAARTPQQHKETQERSLGVEERDDVMVAYDEIVMCPKCGLRVDDRRQGERCYGSYIREGKSFVCDGFFGEDVSQKKEVYKWTKFGPMSSEYDDEDVRLGCNNDWLVIKRGVWVPLPGRFLEVAQHAHRVKHVKKAGHDRKVPVPIQQYTFITKDDPCGREDFEKYKREGSIARRRARDRAADDDAA
jgi:hypothetical protein